MIYHVKVILEAEYWDIEARNEEEAFEIASDEAMSGGDWLCPICEVIDDE